MIEFDAVTRNYGDKTAVDGLTLTIPPGEIFAFLGPNGAGKTTSIKMLVGLLRPTSGTVRVCGFDMVRQTQSGNRRMGYVPDEPHLYDKLTGREFLEFIAGIFGLSPAETRDRIDREVAHFELAPFADELVERYSHGMKQRTAFAAALLHDPAVLVVDEPMVGLDPHSARLVKNLLRERAADGACVFMSTHDLPIAQEIATRIGVIHQSKLLFLGSMDDLRARLHTHQQSLESLYLELIEQARANEGLGRTVTENVPS